jgi:Cu-Zn family superoxide dismutase
VRSVNATNLSSCFALAFGKAGAFAYHAMHQRFYRRNVVRHRPGGSMKRLIFASAVGALGVCSTQPAYAHSAVARLEPTKGNATAGSVTFTQKGDKVVIEAKVSGLTPGGHGFHIHEKGDCSSGDGMSAGGHFNPTGKPHGNPSVADHHTGDLTMLVADASGNVSLSMELGAMTIGGGATDIVGKAVIVHKDPDDYTTQPTGNSGARVACGVIAKN